MRRLIGPLLAALCVGAALVPSAGAKSTPRLTVEWAPRDVRVSDSKAQFKGEQDTLFETSVAIDPDDPKNMIGFAIDLSVQNKKPRLWSVTRAYRSTNGGRSWSDRGFMRFTTSGRDITSSGDPVALFDGKGNAYYASLADPPGRPDGIYVHRSTDGGATWAVPVVAVAATEDKQSNVCTATDKEWLSADRKSGKLYLAYTLFTYQCSGGITTFDKISDLGVYMTSSIDRGKTWAKPKEIWPGYALGAMPRVGPDGILYIGFWATVATPPTACPTAIGVAAAKGGGRPFASIVAGTSKDGGKTWSFHQQPICDFIVGEVLKPGSFVGGSIVPSVAVDSTTGAAYIAYPSFLSAGDRFTIDLISSTDGGKSWSPPVHVTPGPGDARVPALAADDGVVRLTYVESTGFRDQNSETADGETRTMYTESLDGGETWSEPVALSTKVGHPTEYTELGDYNTLAIEGNRIAAMWTDARNPKVTGEIWARVGTIRVSGRLASKGDATTSQTRSATSPVEILTGPVPSFAPTHRAITTAAVDELGGSDACSDRVGIRRLRDVLRKVTSASVALHCPVGAALKIASLQAKELGLRTIFREYEGFEGELFLANRDRVVLVKVTRGVQQTTLVVVKRM